MKITKEIPGDPETDFRSFTVAVHTSASPRRELDHLTLCYGAMELTYNHRLLEATNFEEKFILLCKAGLKVR